MAGAPKLVADRAWNLASYVSDGNFTRRSVFDIAFETNGVVWIAAGNGLHRFDGFTWENFATNNSALPSSFIRSLRVTKGGVLWVGTDNGAGVFDGKTFDRRGSESFLPGPNVRRIDEDPDGTLWFSCDRWPDIRQPGGIASLKDGVWKSYGVRDGMPFDHVISYYRSQDGRQFICTSHGLAQRIKDRWVLVSGKGLPESGFFWSLSETPDGSLIAHGAQSPYLLRGDVWKKLDQKVFSSLRTREGGLVGCSFRENAKTFQFTEWRNGGFTPVSAEVPVDIGFAEQARQAPDGSIWAVAYSMVVRWDNSGGEWKGYANLPAPRVVDPQGSVWFSDGAGAVKLSGGQFIEVPEVAGVLQADGVDGVWAVSGDSLTHFGSNGLKAYSPLQTGVPSVLGCLIDARKTPWIYGVSSGDLLSVAHFEQGKWVSASLPTHALSGVVNAVPDPAYGIWLAASKKGTSDYEIIRATAAGLEPMVFGLDKPPSYSARVMADSSGLWIQGYNDLHHRPAGSSSWSKVLNVPHRGSFGHLVRGDELWLFFAQETDGKSGIGIHKNGAWRHLNADIGEIDLATFMSTDGWIFRAGNEGVYSYRPESEGDLDFTPTPGRLAALSIVMDPARRLWIGTSEGCLMREPSKDFPRTFVTGSETRLSHDAVIRFAFKSLKRFAPRQVSSQFSWKLDDAPWSAFQVVEGMDLPVAGLASGKHVLAVRSRDPDWNIDQVGAEFAFEVLPVPLQGRPWFTPLVAAVGAGFLFLLAFLHRRSGELSVANAALVKIHGEQEERVAARTRELSETNAALLREVTERKLAEKSLGEVTSLQKEILDRANFSIISTDVQGLIVVFNHCAEKLLGYTAAEVTGKASLSIVHDPGELRQRAEELAVELGGGVQPGFDVLVAKARLGLPDEREWSYCRKDGSKFPAQVSFAPLEDTSGRITGYLGIARDLTEHKAAQESQNRLALQLQQSRKLEAIGTMAGGIAHDFNNILTAIMGNAELAQVEVKGMPAASEYLAEISKASRRARDLIQQILTFSRRREQTRQVIRLDPVIQEAVRLMRATLPVSIDIAVDSSTGCPAALADSTQVHQVLMNLCTNAAHAIGLEKGSIRISQSLFTVADTGAAAELGLKPGDHVRIDVADTGSGIEEQTLERIFDPFFTTKGPGGGTGLGLAVVHGIMRSHEGAVTVESVPGKGTVFSLFFPAALASAAPRASISPAAQGAGQRILLIDDEPAIVSLGTKMLRRLGYLATGFDDPVAALASYRKTPAEFDLVITDLTMPGMTGLDVAREIRGIPVVLSSGLADRIDVAKARELGFAGLLPKPYSAEELSGAVAKALKQRHAQEG